MAAVDLLLVGRDGNGKSSTGNSILNQKAFVSRSSTSSDSNRLSKKTADIEGKLVTVVDGVSLRDGSIDDLESVKATINLVEEAVKQFNNGFTALIIVLKYGVRFTSQEKSAIDIIRSLFGANVIKKYGVVVMTYGDTFAYDMEEDRITFEAWCQKQTGDVQELFKECGHRYVLFNNKAKDITQFKNLMSKVAEIKNSAYTIYAFNDAKSGHRKLIVHSKLPELQRKTNSILDFVTQGLRKLDDDSFYSPSNYLNELDRLKQEINNHKTLLDVEDEGTNLMGQLKLQISITEASINSKRERYLRKREYEEMIKEPTPPAGSQRRNIFPFSNQVMGLIIVAFCLLSLILIYFVFM